MTQKMLSLQLKIFYKVRGEHSMQDLLTSFINKKENEKEGITIIVSEHVEKFLPYKMIYHEAKDILII